LSRDADIAVKVSNLSKMYRLYSQPSDMLWEIITRKPRYREFWALRDVSFEVKRGEMIGIMGRNGAGKSTLLKILTGTLDKTGGEFLVNGKLSSILELGTGFHPEHTGEQNIRMGGLCLGLSRADIESKLDWIIDFSELRDFMSQPLKTFSTGMQARLAFSTAISIEPDVLIVDEALAVGDAAFQRKCFARIEQIKRDGTSVLFVSHATNQILDLCERAMVLHGGHCLFVGNTKRAVSYYQKLSFAALERANLALREIQSDIETRRSRDSEKEEIELLSVPEGGNNAGSWLKGGGELSSEGEMIRAYFDPNLVSRSTVRYPENGAEIRGPRITTLDDETVNCLISGEDYRSQYEVFFKRDCRDVRFRTLIKSTTGVELGGGTFPTTRSRGRSFNAGDVIRISFQFGCKLGAGTYFLNCGVSESGNSMHRIMDALAFRVDHDKDSLSFGVIDFEYRVEIKIEERSGGWVGIKKPQAF
jgi:lipopolysaccharide transport system ATP-binding protein